MSIELCTLVDIGPDLLELSENVTGVRFFETLHILRGNLVV